MATTPDSEDGKTRLPSLQEQIQQSLGFYVAIESTWHVALYAACYRYRPFVLLSKTAAGKQTLTRLQNWRGSSQSGGTSNAWSAMQRGIKAIPLRHPQRAVVALSEWFFFNKVIGIPLFPTKVLLAGWLSANFKQCKQQFLSLLNESSMFGFRTATCGDEHGGFEEWFHRSETTVDQEGQESECNVHSSA